MYTVQPPSLESVSPKPRLVGERNEISDASALRNWKALKAMASTVKIEEYCDSSGLLESDSNVIVDALLGTGVKGKVRQPILRAIGVVNGSGGLERFLDQKSGVTSPAIFTVGFRVQFGDVAGW